MEKDEIKELLGRVGEIFEQEENLIEIDSGRVVFVGDTHGDIEATEQVLKRYLNSGNKIVFLGDYVDRGPSSEGNINLLFKTKLEHPEGLFLLMGNHEGRSILRFHPADFWDSLDPELYERYASVLSSLPLAVSTSNGIIALHGALPKVETLEDINLIVPGDEQWEQITWGDWQDEKGFCLNSGFTTSRPQFGRDWFETIMSRLEKNVLIRSHQPGASPVMFDGRCLTIFTSSAYSAVVSERTVAIADLSKEIKTVDDLVIETV